LIEDLRRLDSDDAFGKLITKGFGTKRLPPKATVKTKK
jgi:hypothetical protein